MAMTNKIKVITEYLDELLPNVGCELNYTKDYELVIAVMLSAQTTDVAVNGVTAILFSKFKTLEKLANAKFEDVEKIIHPIGMSKNKTNNAIGIAKMLLNDYGGIVPSDKDELQKLPGVGNKTAGVIRAEIFKIPDLPVDTHILRITKRLKLASTNDGPLETEIKLKKLIPEASWIKTHHQLIHFGRYHCLARNPKCENCKIREFCSKN